MRKSIALMIFTFATIIPYVYNYEKAVAYVYHFEIIMFACTYFIVKQLEENGRNKNI